MRADLPPAIRELIAQLSPEDGPQLIFDRAQLHQNFLELASAARAPGIQALFAVKAFPHPEVLKVAAALTAGFDVASIAELELTLPLLRASSFVSITDPTGRAGARLTVQPFRPEAGQQQPDYARSSTSIISCESLEQLERAITAAPHARFAARISSSILGRDRAVGSIQSGDGHHRSRFGVDVDPTRARALVAEMAALAASRGCLFGLHLHHSGVVPTSIERFLDSARAILALAASAGVTPSFLNLGGSWHGVTAKLSDALRALASELRAVAPNLPILVEPGRLLARDAGYALGWIQSTRALDDRLLSVLDLSRVCHLRWGQPSLVAPAPRPGRARKLVVAGPTCYEDDLIGEWLVDEDLPLAPGTPLLFRDVTGYAVAWNSPFAGVPAATVRLAGEWPSYLS